MTRIIGKPISRIEGVDKVTGRARFAADTPIAGVLHAVIVPSRRAHARIVGIESLRAERSVGVVSVYTHLNAPRFVAVSGPPFGHELLPLQGASVMYDGQPVALVVADTLENAFAAAGLVDVTYEDLPFTTDFARERDAALAEVAASTHDRLTGEADHPKWERDTHTGDVVTALSSAAVKVEATYHTADRHHNPIEPSATLAVWKRGNLTLYDTVQGVTDAKRGIAKALGLPPERVRVRSAFVGGGFGCKGWVWPHQLLAAMAARHLRAPVKLCLTRANTYTAHGYQGTSTQRIALGATQDGRLTGIRHDSALAASFVGHHIEGAGLGTRSLYACASISTTHRAVRLHRGDPTPMRAPLEGVGLVALECAMDELAYELDMDPLALRLANHADVEPSSGRPFSSKMLRECYARGAEKFRWSERDPKPRSMRDGRELVGCGMATAFFAAFRSKAQARVSIDRNSRVLVETGTQEIGTGSRTILPQIAADVLGVPVENVQLAWGDTTLPAAPMTAGSMSCGSVGSAVHDAALKLRARLTEGGANDAAAYAATLSRLGVERLAVDGEFAPAPGPAQAMFSFGAVFAEVRVDEFIPIPRVSRIVAVYDAGRIINPKTARGQMIGGLTWGIGQALLESSEMDQRMGRFLSKNLSGYLIPCNADVGQIDVSFVDAPDLLVNPLGARGIGELGAIGVGAAIANATFHATGVRVRRFPIRPEDLLA